MAQRRVTLGKLSTLDPDAARKAAKQVLAKAGLGQDHQAAFSWDNFKKVKDKFPDVKFMLKGIGTAEDADIA